MRLKPFRSLIKKIERLHSASYSRRFYLCFFTTVAVISVFYLFYQTHHTERSTHSINGRSVLMLNKLHGLQNQLQHIQNNSHHPSHVQNTLSALADELKIIEKSTANNAKVVDIQKISDQLLTLKDDLTELEKNIMQASTAKEYLNPKKLPFQLNHLDMISGQPFISVNEGHHITPLILGDSLRGWTLTKADYSTQTVEFTNTQGQQIQVKPGG